MSGNLQNHFKIKRNCRKALFLVTMPKVTSLSCLQRQGRYRLCTNKLFCIKLNF